MEELLAKPVTDPKVVLFDMDGVLVDSMPTHARTWYQTAQKYGLKAEESEFYNFEGMKGSDTIRILFKRTFSKEPDATLIKEIYDYKTALFVAHQADMPVIPGVLNLIKSLKDRGVQIGVVTGSTLQNAQPRIERYFSCLISTEHLITADIVTNGKPHPDPYLMGVDLFNASKKEVVVIENAPLGVRSAHSAGIFTMAVTTGPIPSFKLREEGANLIFPNMKALHAWWQYTYLN